jgi:hypothetical protein
MRATNIWGLLPVIFAFWFTAYAHADQAIVVDEKGAKVAVTDLRAHKHDSCKGFVYYTSSSTETDQVVDFILLEVGGGKEFFGRGRYMIEIPLGIIASIKRKEPYDRSHDNLFANLKWNLVLSDGTTLTGRPVPYNKALGFDNFTGKTELGQVSIQWERVTQITFASPQHEYTAKHLGTHSLTIMAPGAGNLKLNGATFVYAQTNSNNCFVALSYKDKLDFRTEGGANFELTWDKIRELRFEKSKDVDVHLISPSGTEYVGRFGGALAIAGVGRIGAFDLHVFVPGNATADKLIFEGD